MELYRKSKRPTIKETDPQSYDGTWLGVSPTVRIKHYSAAKRTMQMKQCVVDTEYNLSPQLGRNVRSVGTITSNGASYILSGFAGDYRYNIYLRADKYYTSSPWGTFNNTVLSIRYFCLTGRLETAQSILPRMLVRMHEEKEACRTFFRVAALIELYRDIPILGSIVHKIAISDATALHQTLVHLSVYFAMELVKAFECGSKREAVAEVHSIINNPLVDKISQLQNGTLALAEPEGFVFLAYAMIFAFYSLLGILEDKFGITEIGQILDENVLAELDVNVCFSKIELLFNKITTHAHRPGPIDSFIIIYCEVMWMQGKTEKVEETLKQYRSEANQHLNAHKLYLDHKLRIKEEPEVDNVIDIYEDILNLNPYDHVLVGYHHRVLFKHPPDQCRMSKLTKYVLEVIDCACTKNSPDNWRMLMELILKAYVDPIRYSQVFDQLRVFRSEVLSYWQWYHLPRSNDSSQLTECKYFIDVCIFGDHDGMKTQLWTSQFKIESDLLDIARNVFAIIMRE